MADLALIEGVGARTVDTPRLRTHLLFGGAEGGAPIFFVHGNVSSSRFFEETLAALARETAYWVVALDLRGFGASETKLLDATRGVGDFSDDLIRWWLLLGWGTGRYT